MDIKEQFIETMLAVNYTNSEYFNDVHEFADMYLQNLHSLEQNISHFKNWLEATK